MPVKPSNKEIHEGILNKDLTIMVFIKKKYYPIVFGYVRKNKGTIEDAEDIFYDTVLEVYVKLNEGFIMKDFGAYFFRIARNKWMDELKKRKDRKNKSLDYYEAVVLEKEEELSLYQIVKNSSFYLELIKQLDEKCKEVIIMFSHGNTHEEVKDELELASLESSRKKRHTCLQKLKKLIKNNPLFKDYFDGKK